MMHSNKMTGRARARASVAAADRPGFLTGALGGLGLAALICARMMTGA